MEVCEEDMGKRLKAGLTLYIVRGTVVGSNFASMILLAFVLPLHIYGSVVLTWSVILLLSAIGGLGAGAYILREMSARVEGNKSVSGISFSTAISLTVIWPLIIILLIMIGVAAGLPIFKEIFEDFSIANFNYKISDLALICLISWLINIISHLANMMRVQGKIITPMVLRDSGPQLMLLIGAVVTLAIWPNNVTVTKILAIYATMATSIVILTSCSIFLRSRAISVLFAHRGETSNKFNLSFWGVSVTGTAWNNADIIIGGFLFSPEAIGIYQIIKRVANLASMPQIVANWAIVVSLSRSHAARDSNRIQNSLRQGAKLSFVPLLVLSICCSVIIPIVLSYIKGPMIVGDWVVFSLLLLGSILNVGFGGNFVAATQCGMEAEAFRSRIWGLIVLFMIIYVLSFTRLGISSLSIANFTMAFISNTSLWWLLKQKLNVDTSFMCLLHRKKGFYD
ncbi:oligosaccharide flippase family protein [Sulfitobacter sp. M220]|uniref:lipopolysaccharide biosynthesis protein n=1 Tax=Sulfitobacter sp. M220 TaxID=2675333 RepID=UPI001F3B84FD|nr:hypothetical protein [Sulfitobacter sp. M220]MCF7779651.1 oligosaccharide flippase family protein [Sulfitobacter sp. M220]